MFSSNRKMTILFGAVLFLLLLTAAGLYMPSPVSGQALASPSGSIGAAITYQGYLTDNGSPANGTYDFQFLLYDALSGGTQVGSTVTIADIIVSDGQFTAALDFGKRFEGTAMYLELGVRAGTSTGAYTTLTPRQPLTAAPYALGLVPQARLTGAIPGQMFSSINTAGDGLAGLTAAAAYSGVYGQSDHTDGYAVFGRNTVNNNQAYLGGPDAALYAKSPAGWGVWVESTGLSGINIDSAGVFGVRVGSSGSDGVNVGLAGGDGVYVSSASNYGLRVNSAGDDGVYVDSAGGNGAYVYHAAGDGLVICSTGSAAGCTPHFRNNGVEIGSTEGHGIYVDSAGTNGVTVNSANGTGVAVGSAAGDGLFVCSTGSETTCTPSGTNDGLEIGHTQGHGVLVEAAGGEGVFVASAGYNGFAVVNAGDNGVFVNGAGNAGVNVSGDNWAGYFAGNINVTGSCTGCLLATFAVNTGSDPLHPGDLVTIQGTRPSGVDSVAMLMDVTKAAEGRAVIGVVQGWAELVTDEKARPNEIGLQLIPREGAAEPGQYVTIVTYGPVQVSASPFAGGITPGMKLTLDANGSARPLQTVEVNGVQLAESAPTIGISLSAPDEKGQVWVLLNPQ
jgi:hypothetical protein